MSPADLTATLAELAAERPARARLFDRLRLDYCCGGSQTLAAACEARGLDPHTVRQLLDVLERDDDPVNPADERDLREAPIGELCDHIVSVHHDRLREELPMIAGLLATVVSVHGQDRPELARVERAFAGLRGELEPHIAREESFLFPGCRALEDDEDAAAGFDPTVLERHGAEHDGVGARLAELRQLAGGYEETEALCSTHRALLGALREFEADLHRHVHEENNLLFPRVRELAAAGAR